MPATSDRFLLLALAGSAIAAVAAIGAWLTLGPSEPAELVTLPVASAPTAAVPTESASPVTELLVDVEGGVALPGLHRLAAGARVADAIDAAGGYAPDADLAAAALTLNLAAIVTDGQQIRVPRTGEAVPSSPADPAVAAPGEPGAGGLVNLNTASPEELDALPGIGPVTVQKIVAARQQAPFASLEDAVARDVMNNGQLEKIRDMATV